MSLDFSNISTTCEKFTPKTTHAIAAASRGLILARAGSMHSAPSVTGKPELVTVHNASDATVVRTLDTIKGLRCCTCAAASARLLAEGRIAKPLVFDAETEADLVELHDAHRHAVAPGRNGVHVWAVVASTTNTGIGEPTEVLLSPDTDWQSRTSKEEREMIAQHQRNAATAVYHSEIVAGVMVALPIGPRVS